MYDIIIIGAGPAGLSAALYAGRSELNTLVIEKAISGGQISSTARVDNYPGSIDNATGMGLSERLEEQAKTYNAKIVSEDVIEVDLKSKIKTVKTNENEYKAKSIIIATGAAHRKLNVPGENEFLNRGVSYCATCDGPFYKDLDVYVIGGGEAAVEEAIYLTKFAKKVFIVHRRDEFRASKTVVDKARDNEKIEFIYNSVLKEIKGDVEVNELILENTKTKEIKNIKADVSDDALGVFIFIGNVPETDIFKGQLEMENGYIITDEDMKTSVEGVYAVGDTRKKKVRQMVTATADGCIAAIMANDYLGGDIW